MILMLKFLAWTGYVLLLTAMMGLWWRVLSAYDADINAWLDGLAKRLKGRRG